MELSVACRSADGAIDEALAMEDVQHRLKDPGSSPAADWAFGEVAPEVDADSPTGGWGCTSVTASAMRTEVLWAREVGTGAA